MVCVPASWVSSTPYWCGWHAPTGGAGGVLGGDGGGGAGGGGVGGGGDGRGGKTGGKLGGGPNGDGGADGGIGAQTHGLGPPGVPRHPLSDAILLAGEPRSIIPPTLTNSMWPR